METNSIVNDDNKKHKTRKNAQESEPPAMIYSRKRMRTGNTTRRWDNLHQSVLLQIFDRVPVEDLMLRVSTVCGSWFAAVLNILFPPTTVLDLRNADTFNWDDSDLGLSYLYFLQIVLDTRSQSQWTTLYTPCKHVFNEDVITYIAQRTPRLRVLFLSMKVTNYWMHEYKHLSRFINVVSYWKNLHELTGFFYLDPDFVDHANEVGTHCKEIRSLNLTGNFGYEQGVAIAKNFPRLEHLHFPDNSIVSMEALLIILDTCKDLVTLDLRHTLCCDEKNFEKGCKAKELTRKVREKVTRVKNYLRCEGKLCSLCSRFWTGAFDRPAWF